jgi:hypothetical protein
MRTGLLSQDEAADLLGDHASSLRDCVERAWQRWERHADFATASKRSRASIVYDYITDEVEKAFAKVDGIRLSWKYGAMRMVVDDSAVIRFKKFRGRRLRTSGISTNARSSFLAQEGVLNGMVVTNLVVGYLLDELELEPAQIAVACPMDSGNLWTLDLDSGLGEPAAVTQIGDQSPGDDRTTVRSTRVAAHDTAVNEE